MKAWIIVGNANTRKSSLVRCLTGAGQCGSLDIGFLSKETHRLYIQMRSLQEVPITANEFVNHMKQYHDLYGVIVSLRINGCQHGEQHYPDAISYLDVFKTRGWEIMTPIAILGENTEIQKASFGEYFSVPDSNSMPTNQFAEKVRANWKWI